MKKLLVRIVLILIVLFAIIQLVPVSRGNPPVTADIPTSPEVKAVLRRACYDCHSHETVYPWYSRVAPVSWLIAYDVAEGREELNYSTWERYNTEDRSENIHESWETVDEGEMPPWYYTVMHPAARLTPEDRAILRAWAGEAKRLAPDDDKHDAHEKDKDDDSR
jgi:hypothetical protein